MVNTSANCLWHTADDHATPGDGVGSGKIRLHAQSGRDAPGRIAYAFGHLHSQRYRQLHNSAGYRHADRHQGHAGDCLAGARADSLRRSAQRRAIQRHGLDSGKICIYAGRGRGAPGGNAHAFGHLYAGRLRGLLDGAGYCLADRHQGHADRRLASPAPIAYGTALGAAQLNARHRFRAIHLYSSRRRRCCQPESRRFQ